MTVGNKKSTALTCGSSKATLVLGTLLWVFLFFFQPIEATAQERPRNWAVTLYTGILTDSDLTHTSHFNAGFEDSYFIDLGLLRRLYTYRDCFGIEIEGQIAKHFRAQNNWEFDLVGYIRWLRFPWNNYILTSFAAGAGLSYVTYIPEIEAKNYQTTAQFLGALMFEFTFSLPQTPEWSLVTGLHHRSGAGGFFYGVHGASNAWNIGLRYAF